MAANSRAMAHTRGMASVARAVCQALFTTFLLPGALCQITPLPFLNFTQKWGWPNTPVSDIFISFAVWATTRDRHRMTKAPAPTRHGSLHGGSEAENGASPLRSTRKDMGG